MPQKDFNKYSASSDLCDFIIEEDLPGIGWYLYVYEKNSMKCIADYVQDTFEILLDFAEKKYNVKHESWKKL